MPRFCFGAEVGCPSIVTGVIHYIINSYHWADTVIKRSALSFGWRDNKQLLVES